MGVPILDPDALPGLQPADLVLDGIIGYSLRGAPRGAAATAIRWASSQPAPILALDAPSGLDTTTGRVFDPAIHAAATLTLGLPKQGLRPSAGPDAVGELYLADISVPSEVYGNEALRLAVPPIFSRADIVRVPTGPAAGAADG